MNKVTMPMNTQVQMPKTDSPNLNVFKIWETIQGEGPFAGRRAVFVRLGGCNLQCPMCDTNYTSNYFTSVGAMIAVIDGAFKHHHSQRKGALIVLTGGEPFRQNFGPFARAAIQSGWHIQVETNGTLWQEDVPILPLTIVCSPKTPKLDANLMPYIKHLKYVIQAGKTDERDGLPTSVLGYDHRPCRPWPDFSGEVWVQPADEGDRTVNSANLEYTKQIAMKFGYRLSLQLHKIIGME